MESTRRSEVVRARRNQRSSMPNKPRKDRKSKNTRAQSMPPVFSRTGIAYPTTTTLPPKPRKKVRRKYNVSLDSAGAEVKLPAIPVISIGWRVLSGLMTAGLLFAIYWMWTASMFAVTDITLSGIARVDKGELYAKADIVGKPVFAVDPQLLESNLKNSIRALNDLNVVVNYPAEVIFEAGERQPVIVWEQAGVTSWWVDIDGIRFAPLGTSDDLVYIEAKAPPPKLPVSPGPSVTDSDTGLDTTQSNEQLLHPEMVSGILFLSDYLPEGTRLIYHEEFGVGWKDPEMGWEVFFGKQLDQMAVRMALYQAIVTDLTERNRRPVLISIEHVKAPYYRMRN